jgi:hypothetical protein
MKNNDQSLLSTLKNLYSQLSQISLGYTQTRLNSFKHVSKSPSNITAILNKQIDDISSQVISESIDSVEDINEPAVQSAEDGQSINEIYKDTVVENVTGVESEFVKYLQQRKPPTITQPHLGENLKASAWQHIHTAIRHAKNGDIDAAKLHINIAGTALEEAGDYMCQEDYSELVLAIEGYFSEPIK